MLSFLTHFGKNKHDFSIASYSTPTSSCDFVMKFFCERAADSKPTAHEAVTGAFDVANSSTHVLVTSQYACF
jgi:hypothetical protein